MLQLVDEAQVRTHPWQASIEHNCHHGWFLFLGGRLEHSHSQPLPVLAGICPSNLSTNRHVASVTVTISIEIYRIPAAGIVPVYCLVVFQRPAQAKSVSV